MARHSDGVHTPDDGRGLRRVYLNGKEVTQVIWADSRKGIVIRHRDPIKLNRWRKRIITETLRGRVIVVPIHDDHDCLDSEAREWR